MSFFWRVSPNRITPTDIFEVRSCQSRQLFRYSINTRGSSLALSFFGGRDVYFNGSLITDFYFGLVGIIH